MAITVKHARYFIATARAGQVSRAALDLNISQSAVTAAIQHLESYFSFNLFERRRGGMALTAEGMRFFQHAERMVEAADEAARMKSESPAALEGTVRLGMTYTVAGYFAVPLIDRCRRRFPGLSISLLEQDRESIEVGLIEDALDLAIMLTSNLSRRDVLDHATLISSSRRLWLPSSHALLRKKSVSLQDVCEFDYIALTVDEAIETQKSYWQAAGVSPSVIFETTSVEAVRTMVASGIGVTVLSDMVYRSWSLDGLRIEKRDLSDTIPTMDVGLAWRSKKDSSVPVQAIKSYLMTIAKDQA